MGRTFISHTFGCRVNRAETQTLDRTLTGMGWVVDDSEPDAVIVNSCAVTGKAEREVRQFIYKMRRAHPHAHIVVMGCAATHWLAGNTPPPPEADDVIPNILKHTVPALLGTPGIGTTDAAHATTDLFIGSGRLMVKIQDGCNRCCSYCIVPSLRGRAISRPTSAIVNDIARAGRPVAEAVLTAINTQAFGIDTGETLTGLIDAVLSGTSVGRVSCGSVHPWSVDERFLSWYRTTGSVEPRFVQFFHVPVQSGCDRTLTVMNRGYSARDMGERLAAIKAINPHAFIGTDVIVGFPGETAEDFEATLTFLAHAPIDRFHVFRFSPRTGTAAYTMRQRLGDVPPAEAAKRSAALMRLGKRKYDTFLARLAGTDDTALVLSRSVEGWREAILGNGVPVMIRAHERLSAGAIVHVHVTGMHSGTARAELRVS